MKEQIEARIEENQKALKISGEQLEAIRAQQEKLTEQANSLQIARLRISGALTELETLSKMENGLALVVPKGTDGQAEEDA